MSNDELLAAINSLPLELQKEVMDFIAFLKNKEERSATGKEREFGCAKGKVVIRDDFDEPLEDFKEYTQ